MTVPIIPVPIIPIGYTIFMTLINLGLLLDIIGVVLLWCFGLPPDVRREGQSYILAEGEDQTEKRKAKLYDCLSKLGLFLIIFGFIVQIVGNVIAGS